jgi:sugar phosphate isomerase/epimerase
VLLENTPNAFSSAERLLQFEDLTHVGLNYCFDTGHAHMTTAGIEHEFRLMKPRIRSTHIHDNNGKDDTHLFPLVAEGGGIDWKKTMPLLRSLPASCPLLLELKERADVSAPLESVRQIFDRLEQQ